MREQNKVCTLQLSNGLRFDGELIGRSVVASGQMVFTTGLVGYEQALSDPSYYGQILMFTYPLIGNYGVCEAKGVEPPRALESRRVQPSAVLVSEISRDAYHWTSRKTLDEWLDENGIPGITGIDTRSLVHVVRANPGILGKVIPGGCDANSVEFYDPGCENVLPYVSTSSKHIVGKGVIRVGLIDCGTKWNIVRILVGLGCEVQVLPWTTDLSCVECDGWVVSNGPGDPLMTGDLVKRIQKIMKKNTPILGICLGNQLLALAAGGRTEKMTYGHRSHNQPVVDQRTGRGYITTQNHGYVVVTRSLPKEWTPWFLNANDGTVEGIFHESNPWQGVQFHPEASSGPRDTAWILAEFVTSLKVK